MKALALLGCAVLGCGALYGSHHHRSRAATGSPGVFDYYLLSLSWSPEYCHTHQSSAQCTGNSHFGFVVHGLWPESNSGNNPENCSNAPGLSDPSKLLDIMPDPSLIQHEWTTHGTCTGLTADNYFALIRTVFTSVHIPKQFSGATTTTLMSSQSIKQAFEGSNSGLADNEIGLVCTGGYLKEVEICFTKSANPQPMACPVPPSACPAGTIKVPPVR